MDSKSLKKYMLLTSMVTMAGGNNKIFEKPYRKITKKKTEKVEKTCPNCNRKHFGKSRYCCEHCKRQYKKANRRKYKKKRKFKHS